MKNMKVLDLCYMALYAALAVVLDYVSQLIPFLQMPQGGSINLAVAAVLVASFHLGWKKGCGVGLLWWILTFLFGLASYYLNPMQYALDYILPALVLGFACSIPAFGKINSIFTGTIVTCFLRFVCTLLSGVYFWPPEGSVAGTSAAWIYSFSYNLWYNLATMIAAIVLVPLLIKVLQASKMNFQGLKTEK